MNNLPEKTPNFRKFTFPLCLLASGFFILYVFLISWFFSGTVRSFLEFILPASTALLLAEYFPIICGIGIFLLSFTGLLLIFREMQIQSFPGKDAYPLLIIFLVITGSVILSVFLPVAEIQKILGLVSIVGSACVPLGISHLLGGLKPSGSDPSGIGKLQSFSTAVGVFGLFIVLLLLYSTLTYVPPVNDGKWHSRMWNFDPLGLLELLLGFIYLTFLMPALGILIFRLGLRFRKIPAVIPEPLPETGIQPGKGTPTTDPRTPIHLTLKMKWALLILAILAALVVGYFVFMLIFNTMPGKDWTQVTTSAPFGYKGGFTSAEYKGKLWLIGGSGNTSPDGEVWYTSDGVTWKRESTPSVVPQRNGASSAVFKDALWVIGGCNAETFTPNNDIWFSSNGADWSEIQPSADFSPRAGQSSVTFKDWIWVVGGNLGNLTDNFTSDVWYSPDGISWEQATPAAGFSPRSGQSSFVFNNRMWVIGGRDYTGYPNDVWNSDDGIHWTEVTGSADFPKGMFNAVVFDNRIWVIETAGIWCSTDGFTWSKVITSAPFYQREYGEGLPYTLVFDNRLWVFQAHNIDMGIWFTMPSKEASCAPVATISVDKITGPEPLMVQFTDASFCRPNQWQWDFGDGSQSTEQNPKHTFTLAGNYTISLIASNNAGESRQSVNVTVFKSLNILNPSAGKNWKLASDNVPFGNRDDQSVIVWNDAMWVIGGDNQGGSPQYNDTWYSTDGSHWTQATQNAGFEARSRHSTVVFNDKLWTIGGMVDHMNQTGWHFPTDKNDVWYSSDGGTWTQAPVSADTPPLAYHESVSFDNRIWVIGKGILLSSPDGIQWNKSPMPSFGDYNRLSVVVKNSRIWVLQYESINGFWNTADGITKTNALLPPYNEVKYSITADSLTVYDNKFWLFRALEEREGDNKIRGELWSSDDGYNWVLITDSVPFAEGTRALNEFRLVAFDKKLWAYMVRGTSNSFTNKWDWKWNTEIWYTNME